MNYRTFVLIFVCFLIQSSSAQIPVNDTRFGSFNVQIRYYSSLENSRAEFQCLGSLISLKHVLTAASCVSSLVVNRFLLNVGSTALLGDGDDSVAKTLIAIDCHPEFKEGQPLKANIAVLTVSSYLITITLNIGSTYEIDQLFKFNISDDSCCKFKQIQTTNSFNLWASRT
jgi:Trypsin